MDVSLVVYVHALLCTVVHNQVKHDSIINYCIFRDKNLILVRQLADNNKQMKTLYLNPAELIDTLQNKYLKLIHSWNFLLIILEKLTSFILARCLQCTKSSHSILVQILTHKHLKLMCPDQVQVKTSPLKTEYSLHTCVYQMETDSVKARPAFIFSIQVPGKSCDSPPCHWSLLSLLPSRFSIFISYLSPTIISTVSPHLFLLL